LTYNYTSVCSPGQVNKKSAYFQGSVAYLPTENEFNSVPVSSSQSADNQAIMGFIHDAKSQYNSISGGVFLGELRETLTMIRNPAKSLRAAVDRYLLYLQGRRGSFRTQRDAEDFLAKSWLEYSFGWVPLISDTKAAAEGLARLIHGDIRYSTARGFGKHEASSKPVVVTTSASPGLPAHGTLQYYNVMRASVIIKGGVSAKAQGPTLDNAMHIFGFTPEEFVPTIWNLLPYSFLADYFLNIGDILEATFFDKTGINWTSKTTISETEYHRQLSFKNPKGWSGSASGGITKVTQKSMNRTSVFPLVPSLEVSLPGEPQKWINMAALAATHKRLLPFN
jgi:hypothetical protein